MEHERTYLSAPVSAAPWLSRALVVLLLLPLGAVSPATAEAQDARAGVATEAKARPPALIGWGSNWKALHDVPRRLERARIVRLAASRDHNLAVTGKGALVAWGGNR